MKISDMASKGSFSGKVLLDSKFVSVDRGVGPAMADIFISYAKADRPLALKLAAMLEAEGWKTWWDTSLIPGDDFRNEIMTELGRARAVIVIWTDASVKSDWVRSEAGRAQADRKLIPHLTYKDLPPPFDVLHTENIGEEDKIRAAVVAQLAKPAVEPSAVTLLTKGFKYELLTWVGIVGGALTLFTNLGAVLKLADWARVLVEHWREWTHAFWVWAFGWVGIHVPLEWTPVLSFLLFGSLLTIGQVVKFRSAITNQPNVDEYHGKSFRLMSWRTLLFVVCMLISEPVWQIPLTPYHYDYWFPWFWFSRSGDLKIMRFVLALVPLVILVMIFAKHDRLHATVATGLIIIFCSIIVFNQFVYITNPESERASPLPYSLGLQ
jgi:hypothetical protein